MRLLLAIAALSGCAPEDGPPGARILYVEPSADGEWDDPGTRRAAYTTLAAALAAASPGDTIAIPAGTYEEPGRHELLPGLTLDGAGLGETILVTEGLRTAGGSGIVISDLSLVAENGLLDQMAGVLDDGAGNTIVNVSASGYRYGVLQLGSTDAVVDGGHFRNNGVGVLVDGALRTTVINGLFTGNRDGGVRVIGNAEARAIALNTVVGNGYGSPQAETAGGIFVSEAWAPVVNNVVVGNSQGLLNIDGAGFGRNLVWGNSVDYAHAAGASLTDIDLDPRFVAPTEGDYRLSSGSPAIDAADAGEAAWVADHDAGGGARPSGAGYDLGRHEVAALPSTVTLRITEVMANPLVESRDEFVEVYNYGSAPIDLRGLIFDDGDGDPDPLSRFFSASYVVQPGAYAVIADSEYSYNLDPYGIYKGGAGVAMVDTSDANLGNGLTGSDPVRLFESDGKTLIDSYTSPSDPGDGISRERVDPSGPDAPENWADSECVAGSSPGAPSCFVLPSASPASALVITEVMANPEVEATGEYVELFNPSPDPIDAGGLVFADENATDVLVGFAGGTTVIPPFEHALVVDPDYAHEYPLPTGTVLLTAASTTTLGNGLRPDESVSLRDVDGTTVISSFSHGMDPPDGTSIERRDYAAPDDGGNWQHDTCATGSTPGRLNMAAGGVCSLLQITEVLANPIDEDTGEFIEIFNAGSDPVELAFAISFSDGDSEDILRGFPPPKTILAPGARAVIVDAEYRGEHAIPSGVVVMSTLDTTLGNGLQTTDTITLLDASGSHVLDRFEWPFNPGNGVSVERVALTGPDSAANWVAAECGAGMSPGLPNCAGSGAEPSGGPSLLLTEVMANPLDEDTGEFVEIYNAGSADVDLSTVLLWDGDALDTLEGLSDPTDTVLAPGGYAVVIDPEHAGEYTFPTSALLLVPDDTSLGSGLATNDPITLIAADGVTVLATYAHPFNPGNGFSAQRVDLAKGDEPGNWAVGATCAASPGAAGCF